MISSHMNRLYHNVKQNQWVIQGISSKMNILYQGYPNFWGNGNQMRDIKLKFSNIRHEFFLPIHIKIKTSYWHLFKSHWHLIVLIMIIWRSGYGSYHFTAWFKWSSMSSPVCPGHSSNILGVCNHKRVKNSVYFLLQALNVIDFILHSSTA